MVNANLVNGYVGLELPNEAKLFSHSYIAGPDFPRMARIWASTEDPFGNVTVDIDFAQQPILRLGEVRAPGGNRDHISRIVAKEFAALADG